jgi:hypothetical protein
MSEISEEQGLIAKYLDKKQPFELYGERLYSSIANAMQELTDISGRTVALTNPEEYHDIVESRRWIVTIGYLCILDKIGHCFTLADPPTCAYNNEIFKAIKYFGYDLVEQDDETIFALCALRHALVHNYCLVNIPDKRVKRNKENLTHRFVVLSSFEDYLIKKRTKPWDGVVLNKEIDDIETATQINLLSVGRLVEDIYSRLSHHNVRGELKIALEDGILELCKKHCFKLVAPR